MNKPATIAEYAQRIERVIDALHQDLDRQWTLDDLAAIACFSPYHFHRIYRAMSGETPDETRRRLLLHRAAGDLVGSSKDLARIAARAGYGSAAAFSRAFAASYGAPPGAFRQVRAATREQPQTSQQETTGMYEVTFATEPSRRVMGVSHRGSYQEVGYAFERLMPLAIMAGADPSRPILGLYYDDPATVPTSALRSFAGIETDLVTAGAELEIREIAGGPVASVIHKGPYVDLMQAYQHLYRGWLPGSGREPADAPAYEIYLNTPRDTPPTELLTRIVLPLKP